MGGLKVIKVSFLALVSLLYLCGCASDVSKQTGSSDYKKMLSVQQQKASATKAEEAPLPQGFEVTPATHEQLGDTYVRQGNAVAAFTEDQRSLEKDPLRTTARYKMGMLFLSRGLPEDALKEFEQVLAREPRNALAHYGRARAHYLQGKLDLAKSDLNEALKINDKLWQAHALLGVISDTEKRHEEAEAEYLKALAVQPNSAAVHNDLGVSYYLTGRFEKAADAFLKAFNIDPENQRICNNLGLALYRLGNTEDALEAFKRGGSDAAAYNNLGYLQMKDRQYKKAFAALEKAIEANPSYYTRAQKNLDKVKAALKQPENQRKLGGLGE